MEEPPPPDRVVALSIDHQSVLPYLRVISLKYFFSVWDNQGIPGRPEQKILKIDPYTLGRKLPGWQCHLFFVSQKQTPSLGICFYKTKKLGEQPHEIDGRSSNFQCLQRPRDLCSAGGDLEIWWEEVQPGWWRKDLHHPAGRQTTAKSKSGLKSTQITMV